MNVQGPLVRPLPDEPVRSPWQWTVPPWLLVALVLAAMLALMIPGLLLDFGRPS